MAYECKIEFELTKRLEEKNLIIETFNSIKKDKNVSYHFKFEKTSLSIELNSSERTATSFILQLYKKLKENLGKKKIGIRSFRVRDYKIIFEIEKQPKEKITIPFVEKLNINGNKIELFYQDLDEAFIRNNNVERTIRLIQEKISRQYYEGKKEYHEILYVSPKHEPIWNKDPSEEMLKRGWIVRGPTKGKWIFRPQFTTILRTMEKIAINELLEPLGFQEIICSNVVDGNKIWKKTGHLEGMPMEIYYVAEPKTRNPDEWESFIDILKITKEIPYEELNNLVQIKVLQGLTYAQCPIIYWSFQKKTISNKDLPIKVFDRTQVSFRYESGGRHGIERVDEFHRIEPVYIGTPQQLTELRDELMRRYKYIFNDIMEIEWRTAWVTPFYLQQSGKEHEHDFTQKIKGTIDFEAWLPYRGPRESSEWLEFQNLSIIGDKYTKAFNIKAQKGDLWSGCTGIGLERWATVFLAQKGLDPKNWPEKFKKYLSTLPKEYTLY
jgi:seryl-tRNA synthetase